MLQVFLILMIGGCCVGISNWRRGLLMMIVIGVLQDPVRKLLPGTPPLMVLCAIPVWLSVYAGMTLTEGDAFAAVRLTQPGVYRMMQMFVLSLMPASILVLQYGLGAWRVAILGVFGYLNPLMAVAAGALFGRRMRDVPRLFGWYCAISAVFMSGTFFEYLGWFPGWMALGTEALRTEWIRYRPTYILKLTTGFFRSPDVMGWHAATLVMMGLTLAAYHGPRRGWPWLIPVIWGAVSVLLGGRRKSIMMPAIWAGVMALAFLRAGRLGRVAGFLGMLAVVVVGIRYASEEVGMSRDYFEYAGTDVGEVATRVEGHSWRAVVTTYYQSGFLGKGIGAASQGMQHLGVSLQRSWQEGGIPKLMVELGVVGLVAAMALGLTIARACWMALRRVPPGAASYPLAFGCAAMVVANGASFVVSHQVYNDPLVMTLTAFFVGLVLSVPWWAVRVRVPRGAGVPPPMPGNPGGLIDQRAATATAGSLHGRAAEPSREETSAG